METPLDLNKKREELLRRKEETPLDLNKKREELLRRKEELARKLQHADRQRKVKRRKVETIKPQVRYLLLLLSITFW